MLQLCKLSNTGSKPTCLVLRTMLKHDPTFHLATVRASDSVIILRHCACYKSTYYYYYYKKIDTKEKIVGVTITPSSPPEQKNRYYYYYLLLLLNVDINHTNLVEMD